MAKTSSRLEATFGNWRAGGVDAPTKVFAWSSSRCVKVSECFHDEHYIPKAEAIANAKLQAAAKHMYDVLVDAEKVLEQLALERIGTGYRTREKVAMVNKQPVIVKIREVLKKAGRVQK